MDRLETAEIADVRGNLGPIRESTRLGRAVHRRSRIRRPDKWWPAQLLDRGQGSPGAKAFPRRSMPCSL